MWRPNVGWLIRVVWVSPNTLVGLLLGLFVLATGGRVSCWRILEFEAHPRIRALAGPWLAVTLGHVIVYWTPPSVRTYWHERAHVRQYEVWGPAFGPAYVVAGLVAVARGGSFYRDNYFERTARAAEPTSLR